MVLVAFGIIGILPACQIMPSQTVRSFSQYTESSVGVQCGFGMYGNMSFRLSTLCCGDSCFF